MKNSPAIESWRYLHQVARMIVVERSLHKTDRADVLQGMINELDDGVNCTDELAFSMAEITLNARTFGWL